MQLKYIRMGKVIAFHVSPIMYRIVTRVPLKAMCPAEYIVIESSTYLCVACGWTPSITKSCSRVDSNGA